MSQQAGIQTLTRTSQSRGEAGFLLALAVALMESCSLPSTPSPKDRSFAWRRAEKSVGPFGAVHPRPAWMAGPNGQRTQRGLCCLDATASLYRRPSAGCFHRAPSLPYFPCSPSVTRLGAIPAPCGSARLCFGLSAALRVSAFRKSFCNERKKIFRTFRKSAAWHLGAGHLASLRARVSRGHSGQIQTGEKRWNSIPTT
jgi:hypothetical protein